MEWNKKIEVDRFQFCFYTDKGGYEAENFEITTRQKLVPVGFYIPIIGSNWRFNCCNVLDSEKPPDRIVLFQNLP